MKILVLPADANGCGFYRMIEPARAVRELTGDSVEVEVAFQMDVTYHNGVVVDADIHGADVVILQRPMRVESLPYLRAAQRRGAAVIVEVDDNYHAVSPQHKGYGVLVRERGRELIAECAAEADLVTVSTPALLGVYARHGRGVVIPNALPRRIAELPPAYERTVGDPVVIGWTGSVGTHPHDLDMVGSGLRSALEATRPRSRLVTWSRWGVAEHGGVEPDHVLDFQASVEEFLSVLGGLDVGIAPLRLDRFNESKSWLKPLEYAGRGVLPVRACTPEYERLGLGLPARRPKDWARWLTRAVTDHDWRTEQAAAAHRRVLAGHLTEHTAERWLAAWRQAVESRVAA